MACDRAAPSMIRPESHRGHTTLALTALSKLYQYPKLTLKTTKRKCSAGRKDCSVGASEDAVSRWLCRRIDPRRVARLRFLPVRWPHSDRLHVRASPARNLPEWACSLRQDCQRTQLRQLDGLIGAPPPPFPSFAATSRNLRKSSLPEPKYGSMSICRN